MIRWLLGCPEEGCSLRRWHRGAHYRRWDNGVWQMWTKELDFGATLHGGVSDGEARAFMETFEPIARPRDD